MYHHHSLAIRDYYDTEHEAAGMENILLMRHILLIEDNKNDVFLIKKMILDNMTRDNFTFTDVPRMVDALELLDRQLFDLVLLDLNLLDIDGSAAVAALHSAAPHIPIIVYSGAHDPLLKQQALLCGAKHYLVKGNESPFAFKFTIENALAGSQF